MKDGEGFKATLLKVASVIYPWYRTGADKSFNGEDILKPIDLINFQYKEADRITKKYVERVNYLSDKSISDKDAYKEYKERFRGGKAFFTKYTYKLEEKKEQIRKEKFGSGLYSYENLSSYEQAQTDFYKQRMKQATRQIRKSEYEKKQLNKKIENIKESLAKLRGAV